MTKGHIIFLNGTSSAGKSTLSWEIQAQSADQYYWISNDAFTDMPHNKFYEENRKDTFQTAITMMYKTARLYVQNGINVIMDHIILDENEKEELYSCVEQLHGIPVTFAFVRCPLEELKRRESARGDREVGNAEKQFKQLLPETVYDVVVDTSSQSILECASIILAKNQALLKSGEMSTAFSKIHRMQKEACDAALCIAAHASAPGGLMDDLIITNGQDILPQHQNSHKSYEYYKRILVKGDQNGQLQVSLYKIPEGKSAYPYHYHASSIELFVLLKGRGTLRTPDGARNVEAGDILYFPTGERGAHKLTNTGCEPLVYVDADTHHSPEVSHMPDSGKMVVYGKNLQAIYDICSQVDYYHNEAEE